MSLYDYRVSLRISADDPPIAALIMAAIRKADTNSLRKIKATWPDIWDEFWKRRDAPGGQLDTDRA